MIATREDEAAATQWQVWTTTARLVVTEPAALAGARDLVVGYLDEVDRACSRFRDDSELIRASTNHGQPALIGALLADYLRAALDVARDTDGDVDPTVGTALVSLGYDRDFMLITDGPVATPVVLTRRVDWTAVALTDRTVTVPEGVLLDLGATAKALAADHCAALVADRFGCGALVSLGGDIATAGPAPAGDWQILVQDGPTEPSSAVRLPAGTALATSSTIRRRWLRGGRAIHHILDPKTGLAVEPTWRTVSVAAESCLRANAVATAAVVRGPAALPWLRSSSLPARSVDRHGRVVTSGGWPTTSDEVRR